MYFGLALGVCAPEFICYRWDHSIHPKLYVQFSDTKIEMNGRTNRRTERQTWTLKYSFMFLIILSMNIYLTVQW